MKLKLYTFGKIKSHEIENLVGYYLQLAGKYIKIELTQLKDEEKKITFDKVSHLFSNSYNIVLSEKGKTFTTEDFAGKIEKLKLDEPNVNFFIGNAFGWENEVLRNADLTLAFSPMTFSHELALVVLTEQLFRCLNLLAGGNYHK